MSFYGTERNISWLELGMRPRPSWWRWGQRWRWKSQVYRIVNMEIDLELIRERDLYRSKHPLVAWYRWDRLG